MLDLISSCEATFLYFGGSVFLFSILVWFLPHCFKLGVMTMVVADIALAMGIAFPRKMTEFLLEQGFPVTAFPSADQAMIFGVGAGIVFFALCFALYYGLYLRKLKQKLAHPTANYDKNSPQAKYQSPRSEKGPAQQDQASFKASKGNVPLPLGQAENTESNATAGKTGGINVVVGDEDEVTPTKKFLKQKTRSKRARARSLHLNDESNLTNLEGNPLYAGVKDDSEQEMRLSPNAPADAKEIKNPLDGVVADLELAHGSAVLTNEALSKVILNEPGSSTHDSFAKELSGNLAAQSSTVSVYAADTASVNADNAGNAHADNASAANTNANADNANAVLTNHNNARVNTTDVANVLNAAHDNKQADGALAGTTAQAALEALNAVEQTNSPSENETDTRLGLDAQAAHNKAKAQQLSKALEYSAAEPENSDVLDNAQVANTPYNTHGDSIEVEMLTGSKVGDVLSAMNDGNLPLNSVKPRMDLAAEAASSLSFADMLDSAQKYQNHASGDDTGILVDVTDDIAHNQELSYQNLGLQNLDSNLAQEQQDKEDQEPVSASEHVLAQAAMQDSPDALAQGNITQHDVSDVVYDATQAAQDIAPVDAVEQAQSQSSAYKPGVEHHDSLEHEYDADLTEEPILVKRNQHLTVDEALSHLDQNESESGPEPNLEPAAHAQNYAQNSAQDFVHGEVQDEIQPENLAQSAPVITLAPDFDDPTASHANEEFDMDVAPSVEICTEDSDLLEPGDQDQYEKAASLAEDLNEHGSADADYAAYTDANADGYANTVDAANVANAADNDAAQVAAEDEPYAAATEVYAEAMPDIEAESGTMAGAIVSAKGALSQAEAVPAMSASLDSDEYAKTLAHSMPELVESTKIVEPETLDLPQAVLDAPLKASEQSFESLDEVVDNVKNGMSFGFTTSQTHPDTFKVNATQSSYITRYSAELNEANLSGLFAKQGLGNTIAQELNDQYLESSPAQTQTQVQTLAKAQTEAKTQEPVQVSSAASVSVPEPEPNLQPEPELSAESFAKITEPAAQAETDIPAASAKSSALADNQIKENNPNRALNLEAAPALGDVKVSQPEVQGQSNDATKDAALTDSLAEEQTLAKPQSVLKAESQLKTSANIEPELKIASKPESAAREGAIEGIDGIESNLDTADASKLSLDATLDIKPTEDSASALASPVLDLAADIIPTIPVAQLPESVLNTSFEPLEHSLADDITPSIPVAPLPGFESLVLPNNSARALQSSDALKVTPEQPVVTWTQPQTKVSSQSPAQAQEQALSPAQVQPQPHTENHNQPQPHTENHNQPQPLVQAQAQAGAALSHETLAPSYLTTQAQSEALAENNLQSAQPSAITANTVNADNQAAIPAPDANKAGMVDEVASVQATDTAITAIAANSAYTNLAIETEPEVESHTATTNIDQSELKPELKQETKTESKRAIKPEAQSKSEITEKTESKVEGKSDSRVENKVESQLEKVERKLDSKAELQLDSQDEPHVSLPHAQATEDTLKNQTKGQVQADPEDTLISDQDNPQTQVAHKLSSAQVPADAETQTEPQSKQTETTSELQTEVNAKANTESKDVSQAKSQTETQGKSYAETQTEPQGVSKTTVPPVSSETDTKANADQAHVAQPATLDAKVTKPEQVEDSPAIKAAEQGAMQHATASKGLKKAPSLSSSAKVKTATAPVSATVPVSDLVPVTASAPAKERTLVAGKAHSEIASPIIPGAKPNMLGTKPKAVDESRTHLASKHSTFRRPRPGLASVGAQGASSVQTPTQHLAPSAQATATGHKAKMAHGVEPAVQDPAQHTVQGTAVPSLASASTAKAQASAQIPAQAQNVAALESEKKVGRPSLKSHFAQILGKNPPGGLAARNVSAILNANRPQNAGGSFIPKSVTGQNPAVAENKARHIGTEKQHSLKRISRLSEEEQAQRASSRLGSKIENAPARVSQVKDQRSVFASAQPLAQAPAKSQAQAPVQTEAAHLETSGTLAKSQAVAQSNNVQVKEGNKSNSAPRASLAKGKTRSAVKSAANQALNLSTRTTSAASQDKPEDNFQGKSQAKPQAPALESKAKSIASPETVAKTTAKGKIDNIEATPAKKAASRKTMAKPNSLLGKSAKSALSARNRSNVASAKTQAKVQESADPNQGSTEQQDNAGVTSLEHP